MNYVFSLLEKNIVPYRLLEDSDLEFTDLERSIAGVNESNYLNYEDMFI